MNPLEQRMQKCIESLQHDLAKLRTGRANTSLLDQISVDYYGSASPLNQVATVSVCDARTLQIEPWEATMVPVIEKAIMQSGLGLNPATQGKVIRVPLPQLTEERRKEFSKLAKAAGEKAKIAIRNIRRDENDECKQLVKSKDMSEDEAKREEAIVQKATDKFVAEVDKKVSKKEQDLMEI